MQINIFDSLNKLLSADSLFITREMLDRCGRSLTVKALIPIVDVTAVWHPAQPRVPPMALPWRVEFACGANIAYPMVIFMDKNSAAAYSIALTNCIDDCLCSAKMNQELCAYEVVFNIAVTAKTEPFEIFYNDSHLPMTDLLQLFRNKIMPEVPSYPAAAWEPVYCTWYAVHAAITGEYLKSNAAEAAHNHRIWLEKAFKAEGIQHTAQCDQNIAFQPMVLFFHNITHSILAQKTGFVNFLILRSP